MKKIDNLDYIKSKNLFSANDTAKKVKGRNAVIKMGTLQSFL